MLGLFEQISVESFAFGYLFLHQRHAFSVELPFLVPLALLPLVLRQLLLHFLNILVHAIYIQFYIYPLCTILNVLSPMCTIPNVYYIPTITTITDNLFILFPSI